MWWILVDPHDGSYWIHLMDPGGSAWWMLVDPHGGSMWWILVDHSVGSWRIPMVHPDGSCWIQLMDLGGSLWWIKMDPCVGSYWINILGPFASLQSKKLDPLGSLVQVVDPGQSQCWILVDNSGASWWILFRVGQDRDQEIRPMKIQYETEKKWMLIFSMRPRQDCLIFRSASSFRNSKSLSLSIPAQKVSE